VLEEAIARDPHYGPALALAASWCMNLVSDGSTPDGDRNKQKAIEFAHRALAVAGDESGVLADAAFALACFGEDIDAMIALVDRALGFNPSYARGWYISGFLRLWAGQTDLAIEHAGMALRLSPRAQAVTSSWLIGAALFFSRRFAEAVPRLRVTIEERPIFPDSASISCGLLCLHGAARRGAGNGCAPARADTRGDPDLSAPVSRSRASRTVLRRPAAGAGRGDHTAGCRLIGI
jgi:tetratricopeptide (TPR) repeat protein